jgi:hypothetical protein
MAVTRIKNNQITDAITGNTIVGIDANTKIQPYSITSTLLANNFTYGNNFTITGNLSVTGTTTAVDTTYTNIQDPLIVLADGQTTGTPSVDIGFIGLRGNQSNIAFAWNEANAEFATTFTTSGMGDDSTLTNSSYADFKSNNVFSVADVSSGGNVVGGNILATGYGSISTGGNITADINISAGANVIGGNVLTTTDVSAGGNVNSNNVNSTTNVSAGGNIIGSSLLTTGAPGNISGTGWILGGNITATGNIGAGSYLFGDGHFISNINGGNVSATRIYNGTSEVNIPSADGNVTVTVNGSLVGTFYDNGVTFTNDASAGGNVTGSNVFATTDVSAGGNVTGSNVFATTDVSAGANVVGGNVLATTNVSAGGNVTGGNVLATTDVSAGANVTGGNVLATTNISAGANIIGGNILTTGSGGNISGSGWVLAGNVSATANVYGANVFATTVSATGNVTGGNLNSNFLNSNGSSLQISASGTNSGISLLTNGTGNIGAGSNYINNLLDPLQPQDAATKYYVDSVAQGLSIKNSVITSQANTFANTAGVTSVVYNQPAGAGNGVGATLTLSTTSQLTMDGIDLSALTSESRVLVNMEMGSGAGDTNAAWNGIYNVTSSGTLATVLTRALDNNTPSELYGSFTFVEKGTDWASTGWVCTNTAELDPITMGVTAINWTQFSGAANYTGGNGISITGTVISTRINTGNLEYDGGGNLQVSSSAQFTTPILGSATGVQISVTGDVSSNNVYATTDVSAGGNVTGGNVLVTTNVSAGGNVTGGNVLVTTNVSAGGNVTGGNVLVTTNVSAGGNVTGGIGSFTSVTATGNIGSNAYLFGDGYFISNINGANVSSTKISNGTSNVNIATANGNITVGVSGVGNVATFYANGFNVTGNVSTTGAVLVGANAELFGSADGPNVYFSTNLVDTGTGLLISTGSANGVVIVNDAENRLRVSSTFVGLETNTSPSGVDSYHLQLDQAGNLTLGGTVGGGTFIVPAITASGNVIGGNINVPTGLVSASGNVTGGNLIATADVTVGGNVLATTNVTAGGNVKGNNVNSTNLISAGGNIQAGATFLVDPADNTVLMGNVTNLVTDSVLTLNATNSFVVPVGTTGQRPVVPYTGMVRFNTSTNQMEVYNNSEWASVGATSYTVISDEQFAGDGSTVVFTLSTAQTTSSCIVSINGVVQIPTLAYAVSDTTLTFTEAPAVGDVIDVRQLTTTTTVTYISNQSGNATVTANYASSEVDIVGNLVATLSATAPSLTTNSTISFQLVNNTTLAFIVRGTDGTTRTATVTLA